MVDQDEKHYFLPPWSMRMKSIIFCRPVDEDEKHYFLPPCR